MLLWKAVILVSPVNENYRLIQMASFYPEIILLNVRWYCLSYRDLEEMMLERGLEVDHSTINGSINSRP